MKKKIASEMYSETGASILIADTRLDPVQITRDLGISPSETWMSGESTVPGGLIKHKQNGWAVDSRLPKSATVEQHAEDILTTLAPVWKKFIQLSKNYYVELSCVVYSNGGDRPELGFNNKVVKQLAEMDAHIDIDFYVLP